MRIISVSICPAWTANFVGFSLLFTWLSSYNVPYNRYLTLPLTYNIVMVQISCLPFFRPLFLRVLFSIDGFLWFVKKMRKFQNSWIWNLLLPLSHSLTHCTAFRGLNLFCLISQIMVSVIIAFLEIWGQVSQLYVAHSTFGWIQISASPFTVFLLKMHLEV